MEPTQFTFKYTGTDELDVNLVIESLKNVSSSLKEIGRTSNEPIVVKVKPFKEGSFEFIFAILSDPNVLSSIPLFYEAIPGDNIVEKFKGLLELIADLKGKDLNSSKHVEGNNYEIITENGDVKVVDSENANTYFQNTGAVTYIENLYVLAGDNDSLSGIKILDKDKKEILDIKGTQIKAVSSTVKNKRSKKVEIAIANTNKEQKTKHITKENVYIRTAKPDLAGNTLWKVVYEGQPQNVKIDDKKFQEAVNRGEYHFANGTMLKVDLEIEQAFDEKLNAYINRSYTVTKFHQIVDKAYGQNPLFPDE
ncbi:MAG: hypothetical protein ACXVNM_01530 [Bacteroidia bacterium]